MADERRKRIPQPWLWALAGAVFVGVLVFVFFVVAVAPSLLIEPLPKGLSAADELKARNDVRATLVQALAGLAVAGGLVVTYRTYRQNRAEQDRTYERELYATAVEQLGHEKAPVRLGALYSLERLAQDKPERRQVIVNVICAYLRMPFSLAPPINPDGKVATDLAERTETQAEINEIGNTWRQERQVRLTAQRILTEHLRDDSTEKQRSTDPPSPYFWPDIHLDLAGAILIDFNLEMCVMDGAEFGGATFSGDAEFTLAIFNGNAGFRGATFNGSTWFGSATFKGRAWFLGATFNGDTGFGKATFKGSTRFGKATFNGRTNFGEATINFDAEFSGAIFNGNAQFRGATFNSDAKFLEATFSGGAGFSKATFNAIARLGGATFRAIPDFDEATFSGPGSLRLERSRVVSPGVEHIWPTGWRLVSDGSDGYTVVHPDDGLEPEESPAEGTAGGERTS